tara:strand:+ start:357 stop:524 length:168 start_codon:yes stop_codon:yes gene_type:complete
MSKELIIIILAPIIMGLVWWYRDKKREVQKLSDRLHNVENNVTQLTNVKYKRRFK